MRRFIRHNIVFLSWGKHWKGIYIHFLPKYCYRFFWARGGFGFDRH